MRMAALPPDRGVSPAAAVATCALLGRVVPAAAWLSCFGFSLPHASANSAALPTAP